MKSIDVNRVTKQIVWHKGTKETWWSDAIRFLGPEGRLTLAGERIYKVRWDQALEVPR